MKKFFALLLVIVVLLAIPEKDGFYQDDVDDMTFCVIDKTRHLLKQPDVLWFKHGVFNSRQFYVSPLLPELKFDGFERDFGYYIVQFDGETTPERQDKVIDIASKYKPDGKRYYYVPNAAWVFRLHNDAVEDVRNLDFIRAVHPLHPSLRVSPYLVHDYQEPDTATGTIKLIISVFQDDDYQLLADKLAQMVINVVDASKGFHREYIIVEIEPERLRDVIVEVGLFEGTEWVEREYPVYLFNDWSRWITQSYNFSGMVSGSRLYAQMSVNTSHTPIYRRNLFGQGQIVGFLDSGLDTGSVFFCDPGQEVPKTTGWTAPTDLNHRKIRAYNRGSSTTGDFRDSDLMSGHGTHVGGSIAGNNEATNPLAGNFSPGDGMAPLARLVFTDAAIGSAGIYTPSDMNTLFNFAQNCGAYIHSNSYGSDSPYSYNTRASQLDEFMWNNKNFLTFWAAGNGNRDGYRTASFNISKNIVSVGATETGFGWNGSSWTNPGSNAGNNPENMASFSSHGPTTEGARRPTLAVPGGWDIWSAQNDPSASYCHTGLREMGGTSMACPTAAGMTALIRQYFMEGFYPSGSANFSDAMTPSGALMKAMLINGTRNMTGSWTIDDVNNSGSQDAPSHGQGYGRVVLDDCMYFDDEYGTDTRKLMVWDVSPGFTSSGQEDEYFISTGPSTTEPLKIVLSFTDYPGSPAAGTPGVNDLDLIVEIDGNTYLGNVFASSGARSTTGGSPDQLNRDEVVWLDPIPNTSFVVRINASAIRTGPQPYALVVTGDVYEGEPNESPETPELTNRLFDNERQSSLRPTFEFKVPTDADGDDLHFQFQLADDSDFTSVIGTYSTASGDPGFGGGPFPVPEGTGAIITYTVQSDLTDGNTYWWRVRAYDEQAFSPWTQRRSFTVNTTMSFSDWFQTTDNQFETGIPDEVIIEGDKVSIATETIVFEDDFDSYSNQAQFEAEWTVNQGDPAFTHWQTDIAFSDPASIRVQDGSTSNRSSFYHTFPPLTEGFVEVRAGVVNSTDEAHIIMLYNAVAGNAYKVYLYFRQGQVAVWDGSTRHNLEPIAPGYWRHFRVDFDCAAGEFYVTVNDNNYGPFGFVGANPSSLLLTAHGTLLDIGNNFTCTAYYDNVRVGYGGGSGYGSIISEPIVFDWNETGVMWDEVSWTQNADDSIVVVCERRVGGSWEVFDSATTAGTEGTFDIGGLGDHDTIRLRAELYMEGTTEPELYDWAVSWSNNAIGVTLREINAAGAPYSQWNLGIVNESDIRIMDETNRVFVHNVGGVPIDIRIAADPIDWTYSTAPDVDQCVILALFSGTTVPSESDFTPTNDYINTSFRDAGTGGGGNFATASNNGVNIPAGGGEELYFLFQAPSTNNQPASQNITIRIQAIAH